VTTSGAPGKVEVTAPTKKVGLPIIGQDAYYRPVPEKMWLRHTRRIAQGGFLLLWIALFLATRDQTLAVASSLPPTLYLITDPLVAALTMGAAQVIVPTLAWAFVFVVFTLIFGRAFCGWICPLGTLIDLSNKIFKAREDRFSVETHLKLQYVKYIILIVMIVGALFGAQWVYLLDPLVLLFRAFAAGVWPLSTLLHAAPDVEAQRNTVWQAYHGIAFAPLVLLFVVLAATAITPRFYCRYLCPLGAFYGLLSRAPLLRRRVKGCDACTGVQTEKQCVSGCRMGAVDTNPHKTQNHECIRCFSGRSFCHTEAISFEWQKPAAMIKGPAREDVPVDVSRRSFLVAAGTGAVLAPVAAMSGYHRGDENKVIRPPRVLDEDTFTDQCIRCAMCVQACPTQTLQLTHLEAGVAGFWTPAITPLVGGCIPDCDACSVACPTDAIPVFTRGEESKWATKMGTVVLEKNRCVCFTENLDCGKCIDICPTKAFTVEPKSDDNPTRPVSVDYVRCVGCGLCELECSKIVFGTPALITSSHGRGELTVLREMPTRDYEVPLVQITRKKT
jgi:polyferredoxin